ncbi:MAG TPA: hypothetical protein VNK82_07485 [Terriglobales bacterium]|nr:hypothetical protein [Terriglobales bacterium]
MAKKRKKFEAVKAVKEMARERVGAPPPTRRAPDVKKQRRHQQKHKPTLGKMLSEVE